MKHLLTVLALTISGASFAQTEICRGANPLMATAYSYDVKFPTLMRCGYTKSQIRSFALEIAAQELRSIDTRAGGSPEYHFAALCEGYSYSMRETLHPRCSQYSRY